MDHSLLPIHEHLSAIAYAVQVCGVTIIVGETGSGKTTQIPRYLYEAGWTSDGSVIVCTQPRRLAALASAARVSFEMGSALGDLVGYQVRFESRTSSRTRIKYVTDGMLLREMLVDPLLSSYSVVMVDEAHERGLTTDILLGLLKRVRQLRPELRLVVASATLEADKFAAYFSTKLTSLQARADIGREPPNITMPVASDISSVRRPSRWGQADKGHQPATHPKDGNLDVCSPTPDLDAACVLAIQGRCYPVEVYYTNHPVSDYVAATVETILQIHVGEGAGDILVFLPGKEDVEHCCVMVQERMQDMKEQRSLKRGRQDLEAYVADLTVPALEVSPLHANLSHDVQLEALASSRVATSGQPIRKCIVATSVAETSVTVEGVVYVVDCGWVKMPVTDPDKCVSALLLVPISQSSASQRAGRAGRVCRGKAYRLYTEDEFHKLPLRTVPEILRADLSNALLNAFALGVSNMFHFDWLDAPSPNAVVRCLDELHGLKALDDPGSLRSPWGPALADIPLHPRQAACLLASLSLGCAEPVMTILAMAEVKDTLAVLTSRQRGSCGYDESLRVYAAREGDHLTLLNMYTVYESSTDKRAWGSCKGISTAALAKAANIRGQLHRVAVRLCELSHQSQLRTASSGHDPTHAASLRGSATPAVMSSACALWSLQATVDRDRDAKADNIRKALTSGLFSHAARLGSDGAYIIVLTGQRASVAPDSVYCKLGIPLPEWIVYGNSEWVCGILQLQMITAISPLWLVEMIPHGFETCSPGSSSHNKALVSHATGSMMTSNVSFGRTKSPSANGSRLLYKPASDRRR